jgi:phosphoglycolate phosphatase
MHYKAILFDLDGTLMDTSKGIYNAIQHVQESLGLPSLSEEQMKSHIGPSPEESFKRSFGLYGKYLEQALFVYKQYSLEYGIYEAELYNGVPELLKTLQEWGYKLGVVTLKMEGSATKMLQHFNMVQYFDSIKGALSGSPLLKSELLIECITCLKLEKNDCLLIGDSEYDAIGAEDIGIDFIGVLYGFGFKTENDVKRYKNVGYIKDVKELRDILMV